MARHRLVLSWKNLGKGVVIGAVIGSVAGILTSLLDLEGYAINVVTGFVTGVIVVLALRERQDPAVDPSEDS